MSRQYKYHDHVIFVGESPNILIENGVCHSPMWCAGWLDKISHFHKICIAALPDCKTKSAAQRKLNAWAASKMLEEAPE